MILTITEGAPWRVQITLYEGHGVDQKAVRHELSLFEIYQVHKVCTEALYAHAKENEALGGELKKVAGILKDHCKQPSRDHADEEHSPMVGG